jgi:formylglycine-generating enzyme required for sulfatase activity
MTGKKYRLPSEAQWEYAARGGRQSKGYQYAGSNNIDEVAWYKGNYKQSKHGKEGTTHPVKTKKANELGLYDMSGNVWEWCADDWHGNYKGIPTDGSAWLESPKTSESVIRGGGYFGIAGYCRALNRRSYAAGFGHNALGLRLGFFFFSS